MRTRPGASSAVLPLLVVDGDARSLSAISRLLRDKGLDVFSSDSLADARAQLEEGPVAAVLCDYRLPDGNSVALLAELARSQPGTARLLMGGDPDVAGLADAINEARIHGFLSKPVSAKTLLPALDRALALARTEAHSHTPRIEPPSPRALVVMPAGMMRDGLADALEAHGLSVTMALGPDDALTELEAKPCELALVATTGAFDAAELVAELRRKTPGIAVALLATEPVADLGTRCLRAGARGLLSWPADAPELGARLGDLMASSTQASTMALHHATQLVLSSPNRESLPASIVDIAAAALAADEASLMLADGAGNLYLAHATGHARTHALPAPIPISGSLAGRVALGRVPVLLRGDPSRDPRFADLPTWGREATSIVFPLYAGQRLLGVLNLNRQDHGRPFQPGDVERTSVLAGHIVLALENARLIRSVVATEKLAAAGELAAGIVHEINNPLAYVLSNVEFVRDGLRELEGSVAPPADAKGQSGLTELCEAAADIESGARRIMEIVHDMRLLSRGELGAGSLFDLNDAVRSAVRITQSRLKQDAELVTELAPGLTLHGHPGQLSQVFINLLVNAEQAMAEAGTTHRRITVSSRRDGDRAVVEVADTGPGIEPRHLPRIFEPFFTTKPSGRGTGLGLSISREIVSRHEGEIRVYSQVGRGTTFQVSLPMAREDAEAPAA